MRANGSEQGPLLGLLVTCLLMVSFGSGCAAKRIRLNPAELAAVYRGGLDQLREGDYAGALRRFKLIRQEKPDFPGLQHKLGLCYAKLGLPGLAVEALESARRQEPGDRDVDLDLAVALELARRPREAQRVYEKLIDSDPDDSRAVLNLGLLYVRRLDQLEQGRRLLERYIVLEPGSPDADRVRRWLRELGDGEVPRPEGNSSTGSTDSPKGKDVAGSKTGPEEETRAGKSGSKVRAWAGSVAGTAEKISVESTAGPRTKTKSGSAGGS